MSPTLIYVLAGFFLGNVTGSWHPLQSLFGKKPPTAQLTELQAKLDAQQAQAAQAAKEAEAVKIAERQKLEAQVRAAQSDNAGTQAALAKVPPANQTPEVKLASRMAQRVSLKLASAIGKLPQEEQDAMIELIDQALSDKQAEVDEAERKLAAMDAQFKATTKARDELQAQIPILTKQAQEAAQKAQETQAAVTAKTQEVKTWADKTQAALAENGSLWSSIKRAVYLIGGGYVFLFFVLPGLVKHLQPDNPLKTVLRNTTGYLTSPLLFHDASAKIEALKAEGEALKAKLESLAKPPTT